MKQACVQVTVSTDGERHSERMCGKAATALLIGSPVCAECLDACSREGVPDEGDVEPMPTTCRRCSDCHGEEHHWLENGDVYQPGDPEFVCKHCLDVAFACVECEDAIPGDLVTNPTNPVCAACGSAPEPTP